MQTPASRVGSAPPSGPWASKGVLAAITASRTRLPLVIQNRWTPSRVSRRSDHRESTAIELMFAHTRGTGGQEVAHSAAAAFAPMLEMFRRGYVEGMLPTQRGGAIFLATLQGIASLINCGLIPTEQLDELLDDAVAQFSRSPRQRG